MKFFVQGLKFAILASVSHCHMVWLNKEILRLDTMPQPGPGDHHLCGAGICSVIFFVIYWLID